MLPGKAVDQSPNAVGRSVPRPPTLPRLGRLALGTVPLGNYLRTLSDAEAEAVVASALELGVRYFDTAPLYGSGLAERRLGAALTGVARDEVIVSTKVGRILDPGAPPDPTLIDRGQPIYRDAPALNPVVDFSAGAVLRSLDESMRRLGFDRVDIVYLHDPGRHDPAVMDQAYPTLDRLRSEGVVGAIGVGASDVETMIELAQRGDFDIFLVAGRTTLLDTTALRTLLPLCVERGITVVAGGVFNSGILSAATPEGASFDYKVAPAAIVTRVDLLRRRCQQHGIPLGAAAIQFPLRHAGIDTVLIGAGTVAELEADLAELELAIPESFWEGLETGAMNGRPVAAFS